MSAPLLQVRVAQRHQESEAICSYELVSVDGSELPAFTAGAHIDVHLGAGLVRQYSLCNSPHERQRYVIGVLRDPATRGGSRALHEQVQQGSVLHISVPRNLFALAAAGPSLLLAGGIGVTPLLAMAEALAAQGAAFALHYCARSPQHVAFRARIAAAPYAAQVQYHYDSGASAQQLDLAALLAQLDRRTHIYFCGPAGFMAYVKATAQAYDWPQAQLHCEYFGTDATPGADGAMPFEVQLASSGKVYPIPRERSVLHVLREAGVYIPAACEQGVCGSCLTRVLDGIPDHRDLYLDQSEQASNQQFTPCCSRAKSSRLVLDL